MSESTLLVGSTVYVPFYKKSIGRYRLVKAKIGSVTHRSGILVYQIRYPAGHEGITMHQASWLGRTREEGVQVIKMKIEKQLAELRQDMARLVTLGDESNIEFV